MLYSGPPVTCDDCVPSAAAGPETEMTGSSSSESELLSDNDTDVEMPEQFNSEGESPVVSASESDWSDDNLDNDQDQDQSEGERMAFFQAPRAELAACTSFGDVQTLCNQLYQWAGEYTIPQPSAPTPSGCRIDGQAARLLPPDLRGKCFPLAVAGDGNCFF